MRVFIYEYLTATTDPVDRDFDMYREGRAMRSAVVEDLAGVAGVEVWTLSDDAVPCNDDRFLKECEHSDRQLVIAPELSNTLAGLSALTAKWGRSLGSSVEAVRLASDKLALAEHWRHHKVPTPPTTDREPTENDRFPLVWKPRDGAGSTATFLIRDVGELRMASEALWYDEPRPMILQEFVPGRTASVAFLCGPRGYFPLAPTFQLLSEDGRFKYQGGELPIPPDLAERAVKLARKAVESVSGLLGFVGVDLVLGTAEDGSRDFAIEINPRLTTSYIGLRALAEFNVAEAMLRVAAGEAVGEWKWKTGRVRFGPDGAVQVF